MLILGVSMLLSGIIDNVPYVATMTPIVSHLASVIPGQAHHDVMWWSLALGGDLGGNLTAVGSSANIVMIGIALKSGNPISFWQFTRKGVLVTAMSTDPVRALSVVALFRPELTARGARSAKSA